LVGHNSIVSLYGHVGDGNAHIKVMCQKKHFKKI